MPSKPFHSIEVISDANIWIKLSRLAFKKQDRFTLWQYFI